MPAPVSHSEHGQKHRSTAHVRVQKLGEQVTRALVSRIVNSELETNAFAPSEQEICKEFGVSKTVAREAIAALVAKGLVSVQHGRRPRVQPSSAWDVFDPVILELQSDDETIEKLLQEMQSLRAVLEPEIAAIAAERITADQLEALQTALDAMEQTSEFAELLEQDLQFHLVLVESTDNQVLSHIMKSLRTLLRISVIHRAATMRETLTVTPDWHRRIFEAVAAHDPEGARNAMLEHILAATMRTS
jgi:DNA-binding FadR family transcriptional regulator